MFYNNLAVSCEESTIVSLISSRMKKIIALFLRFPGKVICYDAFGLSSGVFYLHKSIAINLKYSLSTDNLQHLE